MLDAQRLTIANDTIEGYTLKNMCSWGMDGEPTDESDCTEICVLHDRNCDDCPIQQAFNRLAEYENTGLSPEEINAMKEYHEK